MHDKFRKNRRLFLTVTASVLPLFALPRIFKWKQPTAASANIPSKLVATLSNRPAAAIIGLEYLNLHPEEANIQLLTDKILPQYKLTKKRISGLKQYNEKIDYQIGVDFKQGNVIAVKGWILARTELRLYALSVLLA